MFRLPQALSRSPVLKTSLSRLPAKHNPGMFQRSSLAAPRRPFSAGIAVSCAAGAFAGLLLIEKEPVAAIAVTVAGIVLGKHIDDTKEKIKSENTRHKDSTPPPSPPTPKR